MRETIPVDPEALRADVREKYREVAVHPEGASTSTPVVGSPSSSAIRAKSSISFRTGPSSPSPVSGTHFSFDPSNAGSDSSTSVPAAGSTASSPPELWGPKGSSSAST
jgi:hypothetical protein